jgi:hypothetical protein
MPKVQGFDSDLVTSSNEHDGSKSSKGRLPRKSDPQASASLTVGGSTTILLDSEVSRGWLKDRGYFYRHRRT